MPQLTINGARLFYERHGSGPETIVFAHGLLWSGRMFAPQIAALAPRYRCVSFDFRGQGRSEVTAGGYDMDTLAADAAGLIEALDLAPCHFVGLSMGGFVGMRLAARRPELLRSLALIATTANPEAPEKIGRYRLLGLVARWASIRLVERPVMQIMCGESFLRDQARDRQRADLLAQLRANDRLGVYRALQGVIGRQGVTDLLGQIRLPTLVVVGEDDRATPPPLAERLRDGIPGARLVRLPRAGHTATLEEPGAVTAALTAFLDERRAQPA